MTTRLHVARPRAMKFVLKVAVVLSCGAVLLFGILQGSRYFDSPVADAASRVAARAAYVLCLPMRTALWLALPPNNHQTSLAVQTAVSFSTPFLYWGLYAAAAAALRADRRRQLAASGKTRKSSITRRDFMARSTAGAGIMAMGYSTYVEPELIAIRPTEIRLKNLPRDLDGFRLLHIADTHYGPFIGHRYLRRVFERASALEADLCLFTGDYVHFSPESVAPGIALLSEVKTRLGSIAVFGNHEVWEGISLVRAAFARSSIRVLENSRVFLSSAGFHERPEEDGLCIGGLTDLWMQFPSPKQALRGVPDTMPRLLLSHNPDVAERLRPGLRVDCMLSGHTHGGQVAFPVIGAPISPSRFGKKYIGGLCQGPTCPVLVSRGVGMAGLPFRFNVPPEFGIVTLRRDEQTALS